MSKDSGKSGGSNKGSVKRDSDKRERRGSGLSDLEKLLEEKSKNKFRSSSSFDTSSSN